ncbi:MAG: helix-turn-helix domain-containing protein [Christensenellales bacterium]|jgi:two-component system response regulator YesN
MLGFIRSSFKKSSLLARQLALFIALIMLCTVLLGIGNALSFSSLMLGETKKSHSDILNQAKSEIDQRYYDIKEIGIQISLHGDVRRAMYYSDALTGQRMEVYKRIRDYLSSLEVSYSYVDDIWIYFKRAKTVVSTSGKCNIDMFFDIIKQYQDTSVYLDYIEDGVVFTTLCAQMESRKPIISFAQAVPLNDPNSEYAVFIDINEDLFAGLISLEAYDNPTYMLLNKDETIIFGNRHAKDLDEFIADNYSELKNASSDEIVMVTGEEKYTLIMQQSLATGYSYIAAIPGSYISDKISPMLGNSYLLMLLTLAVGIAFSYYITRALYTPIRGIVEYINISGTRISERDEIAFIDRFIQMVYEQNRMLKKNIDANRLLIRDRLIRDILAGHAKASAFQSVSISNYLYMPQTGFTSLAFQLSNDCDDRKMQKICDALASYEKYPELIRYFIPEKSGIIACAVNTNLDTRQPELIYDLASGIKSLIFERFCLSCTVGIGRCYEAVPRLSDSYNEAMYALKYKSIKGENTVIHVDEVSFSAPPVFIYTMEAENRLMNYIKTGELEAAEAMIDDIVGGRGKQSITPEETNNIFIVLASTVIKVAYDTGANDGVEDIYRSVQECDGVEEKRQCLLELIQRIYRSISEKRVGQYEQVYDSMVAYIHENYASDISLNILKDEIGFSGSYLSYIFKQVSGENYVDYINKYRIEKAKELLEKTKKPIVSISESCGFNTPNNFIRVFKKYEGITPGQFRFKDR